MSVLDCFINPDSPITLRRFKPTRLVNGKRVPPSWTDSRFEGNIQRLSPQELMILPEGDRTKDAIKVYSEKEIKGQDEQFDREPDQICQDGRFFQVQKVERWNEIIPHYKAIAIRLEKDDDDEDR